MKEIRKADKLQDAIGEIRDDYILDAHSGCNVKKKSGMLIKLCKIAACLCLATGLCIAAGNKFGYLGKDGVEPLSVSAAELGKESYDFGITLTNIVYADKEVAVLYDFRGIYVYNFEKQTLDGFVDFRENNLSTINGDGATCVDVSSDGKYIRVYTMPSYGVEQRLYIYEVEKNKFSQVESYDTEFESYQLQDITEQISISNYSSTYKLSDGACIAFALDEKENMEECIYGDLYLIVKDGDDTQEYYVFK